MQLTNDQLKKELKKRFYKRPYILLDWYNEMGQSSKTRTEDRLEILEKIVTNHHDSQLNKLEDEITKLTEKLSGLSQYTDDINNKIKKAGI